MKRRAKPHVEIKTGKYIDSTLAKKLAKKGVVAVVATKKITAPAKEIFEENKIAWAEFVTEKVLQEKESEEREP
jgi:hypothetical protein